MKKILVIEDDRNILKNLKELLEGEGYLVFAGKNKKQALDLLKTKEVDLVLLDVTLPDGNGYEICEAMGKEPTLEQNITAPILFITALDDEENAVKGLDMGAEDYIIKPFRPRELLSRIKNTLGRSEKKNKDINLGKVKVDTLTGKVYKEREEVVLSTLEYKILLVFLNNRGEVLSRDRLLEEIWSLAGEYVSENTITVYIKRIREKLEDDPKEPKIIETVRGKGYLVNEYSKK